MSFVKRIVLACLAVLAAAGLTACYGVNTVDLTHAASTSKFDWANPDDASACAENLIPVTLTRDYPGYQIGGQVAPPDGINVMLEMEEREGTGETGLYVYDGNPAGIIVKVIDRDSLGFTLSDYDKKVLHYQPSTASNMYSMSELPYSNVESITVCF